MISGLWQAMRDADLPPWLAAGMLLLASVAITLDRLAAAASKLGLRFETNAEAILELNADILRLRGQLKQERKRADHEARSKDAVDAQLATTRAELDALSSRYVTLCADVGRTTKTHQALKDDDHA